MRTIKHGLPTHGDRQGISRTIVSAMLLTTALVTPTAFAQTAVPQHYLQQSDHAGKPDNDGRIVFTGQKIRIPVVAVEPGKPDTTFEIHDQVDPTLVVPANTPIRMTLANMDEGMTHGLDVTSRQPPYKTDTGLPMRHGQNPAKGSIIALTGTAPPHAEDDQPLTLKATSWFRLKPGHYYYVCPVPGHAHKGMHGEIIAR